jgi:hypothetical protein
MGYAVAEALTSRGNWDIHIFDMNLERGKPAADELGATFHEVNVGNPMGKTTMLIRKLPFG